MGCVRVVVLAIATWTIGAGFLFGIALLYRAARRLDNLVVVEKLQHYLQFHLLVIGPILLLVALPALLLEHLEIDPWPVWCK